MSINEQASVTQTYYWQLRGIHQRGTTTLSASTPVLLMFCGNLSLPSLVQFVKELRLCFPNSQRMNRGFIYSLDFQLFLKRIACNFAREYSYEGVCRSCQSKWYDRYHHCSRAQSINSHFVVVQSNVHISVSSGEPRWNDRVPPPIWLINSSLKCFAAS